jgi:regulator of cell morphogenesis and NO signaling
LACEEQGEPFPEIVEAIEASARGPQSDGRDWTSEPLEALIDHIIGTYHQPLRDELPRLVSMADKVSRVHSPKAPHLARMAAIVAELSADLQLHMRKEELVLFPAIRRLEARFAPPDLRLEGATNTMEHEHDNAGALLSELRVITDDHVAPEWACETLRALYHGLSDLEAAMRVHVHLENNLLFPRALALDAQRSRLRPTL